MKSRLKLDKRQARIHGSVYDQNILSTLDQQPTNLSQPYRTLLSGSLHSATYESQTGSTTVQQNNQRGSLQLFGQRGGILNINQLNKHKMDQIIEQWVKKSVKSPYLRSRHQRNKKFIHHINQPINNSVPERYDNLQSASSHILNGCKTTTNQFQNSTKYPMLTSGGAPDTNLGEILNTERHQVEDSDGQLTNGQQCQVPKMRD